MSALARLSKLPDHPYSDAGAVVFGGLPGPPCAGLTDRRAGRAAGAVWPLADSVMRLRW